MEVNLSKNIFIKKEWQMMSSPLFAYSVSIQVGYDDKS